MPELKSCPSYLRDIPCVLSISWTLLQPSAQTLSSYSYSPISSPWDCPFSPTYAPLDSCSFLAAVLVPCNRITPLPASLETLQADDGIIYTVCPFSSRPAFPFCLPSPLCNVVRAFLSSFSHIESLLVRIPCPSEQPKTYSYLSQVFPTIPDIRVFYPTDPQEEENLISLAPQINPFIAAATALAVNYRTSFIMSALHRTVPTTPTSSRMGSNYQQCATVAACPSSPLVHNVYTRSCTNIATSERRPREIATSPLLLSPPGSPVKSTRPEATGNIDPYQIGGSRRLISRSCLELPSNTLYLDSETPMKRPKAEQFDNNGNDCATMEGFGKV